MTDHMADKPTITVEIPVVPARALVDAFWGSGPQDWSDRPDLAAAAIENALKAAGE